jgi:APA family basic amino acid/polyamine antiporter
LDQSTATSKRDLGLVRAIGPWGLASGIVNVVVGAGIFAVPASLAANVGPFAPFAFLLCSVAIGAVAICFAEGGSRIPTSGGAYGYITAAFGTFAGYVGGTLIWLSNALACGGVVAALADVGETFVLPQSRGALRAVVIVSVVGGIASLNLGGVARGTRLVTAATLLKLIPLGVFVVVGTSAIQRSNFAAHTSPDAGNLGRALILALFAFQGMETPLSASGEVANPTRTIPRALAISMVSVTALYIAIQVVAQGILGPSLGLSKSPLADAMAQINPGLRLVMLVGAAVSMFAWIGSDILGTPRVLFAFARDGLLPRVLGRLNAGSQTPRVAILCYAALVTGLGLTGTFAELAVLSALGTAVVYIAACGAAWLLARKGVALAGPPLQFRWLGPTAVIGVGSMAALIALGSRSEVLGLLAVLCLTSAVYSVQSRVRRGRHRTTPPG